MRIESAGPMPACKKLLDIIRGRDGLGTIPDFCERHNLPRQKVEKAIKGELKRVDVEFALDVQLATAGGVSVPDWRLPQEGSDAAE